jgi:hypothetical protein
MFVECRHIMVSGKKCEAPALKGRHFCYYHTRLHRQPKLGVRPMDTIEIPDLEDRCSIQFALTQVLRHLVNGNIDRFRAATAISGLKLGSHLVDRSIMAIQPYETVAESTQSTEGDDLGPEATNCDWEDDCIDCPRAEICPNFDLHKNDAYKVRADEDGDLDAKTLLEAMRLANCSPKPPRTPPAKPAAAKPSTVKPPAANSSASKPSVGNSSNGQRKPPARSLDPETQHKLSDART